MRSKYKGASHVLTTTESMVQELTQRGFGGHCFPKDTEAFSVYANTKASELIILRQAIASNNKIRSDV